MEHVTRTDKSCLMRQELTVLGKSHLQRALSIGLEGLQEVLCKSYPSLTRRVCQGWLVSFTVPSSGEQVQDEVQRAAEEKVLTTHLQVGRRGPRVPRRRTRCPGDFQASAVRPAVTAGTKQGNRERQPKATSGVGPYVWGQLCQGGCARHRQGQAKRG